MASSENSQSRLKSLELQGYKTFASKTPFVFAPTITAIVGPNGSGKSNIADALRWVLGEQAYSLLRGKRTEDMIFSGSELRSRAGMASAMIAFDNRDGWLPIEFSEVTVGRKAYRDGQNEYALNGQRVRLRDVQELLARSGLAQRTYTFIGQGLVDTALSLKADERRRLFEEAAGIGLYRSRREEALRRLDATRRNLERAQDILTELRPRLRSLERQAKRTLAYEQVKKDLKSALQTFYGHHWYQLLDQVKTVQDNADERRQACETMRDQHAAVEGELADTRKRIDSLRSKLHQWSQQVTQIYDERETHGRNLAVAQERLRWLADQEKLMQSEMASLEGARSGIADRLNRVQEDGERARVELTDAESVRDQLAESGAVDANQREAMVQKAQAIRGELQNVVAEEAAWAARKTQLEERMAELENRQGMLVKDLEKVDHSESEMQTMLEALRVEHKRVREKRSELENSEADQRKLLKKLDAGRLSLASKLLELRAKEASLNARLQVFRERSIEIERFAERLRQAVETGDLSGLHGRIDDQLKFSSEYAQAITAAMGDFRDGLAFESLQDLLNALSWIEKGEVSTSVPLFSLSNPRDIPALDLPDDPDLVGIASDLVSAPKVIQPAVHLLLGRTLVVKNRGAARRILPNLPLDARLVTLRGDVFYPTGQVLFRGKAKDPMSQKALQRVQLTLEKVLNALQVGEDKDAQLRVQFENGQRTLEENRSALMKNRDEEMDIRLRLKQGEIQADTTAKQRESMLLQQTALDEDISRLKEDILRLVERATTFQTTRDRLERELKEQDAIVELVEPSLEMARVEARLEVARRAVDEVDGRVDDLEERVQALDQDLLEWTGRLEVNRQEQERMRVEVTDAEKSSQTIEKKLADLAAQREPTEQELSTAEQTLRTLESSESSLRETLQKDERERAQLEVALARKEEEIVGLRRRIEDDFGMVAFNDYATSPDQEQLHLEGFVEKLPRVPEIQLELEGQVNSLRAQLRRMGSINPEAQAEYAEVKERTDFLKEQIADLRSAETQIQEVIAELDVLMESEFRKTFDAVAEAFQETFTRLFDGGSARLVLTNPHDLNETGIDIEARLPGRRAQGLAVLSGGERSLTACALIFALLKVSPPPFCVLDEVDAMLDDVNVIRYIEMLRELSHETQFVLITHNRLTVQAAEMVYGVSMEADSVSRVISLKLDEAEEMIPA